MRAISAATCLVAPKAEHPANVSISSIIGIIAHLTASSPEHKAHNFVDGREVPVWHFDVIRFLSARKELAEKLHARGVSFIIKPQIRFEGLVSEQTAFGTNGFGGNLHKVKAFANDTMVFAS